MISVYNKGNQAYEKNGNVVVMPLDGKVRMIAGGNYDLQMTCPMDPEGRWLHLIEEAVTRRRCRKRPSRTPSQGWTRTYT